MDRFVRVADRDRFALGASLLRLVAAEHLGCEPDQLSVDRTCPTCGRAHWRPRIEGDVVHCSVSHSGTHVLVALSGDGPLGIDIETGVHGAREFSAHLGQAVLARDEEAPGNYLEFLRLWTRKEALLKLSGRGFDIPPQAIRLSSGCPPALLAAPEILEGAGVSDLEIAAGTVSALAAFGPRPSAAIFSANDRLATD